MKRTRIPTTVLIAILSFILGIVLRVNAHPPADCYESSPYCEYVQIATPGGGVKMAYVCD